MITLLDGATGTELERRGFPLTGAAWSALALIENPDLVLKIHLDYLQAGCDVITTNSFRTTKRALVKSGFENKAQELTQLSVKLAKEAIASACKPAFIAGSIAPLEDCFEPQKSPENSDDEFLEFAEWLTESGCDLLLLETMNNIREIRSAIKAVQKCQIPYWLSVNPANNNYEQLLSGEQVLECLRIAQGEGANAFLVNCAGMAVIENSIKMISEFSPTISFGGYANNGIQIENGIWDFSQSVSHRQFASHCVKLAEMGATKIGGCCGMTPEHLHAAAQELRD